MQPYTKVSKITAERSQILNYVWLSNAPSADTNNPLPEPYARNAARIANENPETQILLWVDKKLHTNEALAQLDTFAKQSDIKIMDLNDIDFYVNTPLFQKRGEDPKNSFDPLWKKVDLVRIAVVDHILRTSPEASAVFYSDLDIVNPQLSSEKTQNILIKHGMVFAKARVGGGENAGPVENQYMGFTRAGASFVSDTLLPETLRVLTCQKHPMKNGYWIFNRSVWDRFKDTDPELRDVTIVTREMSTSELAQRADGKSWGDVSSNRDGCVKS